MARRVAASGLSSEVDTIQLLAGAGFLISSEWGDLDPWSDQTKKRYLYTLGTHVLRATVLGQVDGIAIEMRRGVDAKDAPLALSDCQDQTTIPMRVSPAKAESRAV